MGRPGRWSDVAALATFVALGLPDGMLGTAWPALRRSFGVPVGDLGLVLVVFTAGSVLVSVGVGRLVRRLGMPTVVAQGLLCGAAAGAGFAAAPAFGAVVGIAFASGVSAGLIDGGLNTAIGLSGRSRLLNLLHAAYGVGTAAGPLVVTVAVVAGSWRPAYVFLLAVDGLLGGLWLHRRRRPLHEGGTPRRDDGQEGATRPSPSGGRRSLPVAVGIAVFFVYTGLEVSAGQWETTFARAHLHLAVSAAGLATFGYWGALSAARACLALVPHPPAPQTVVRWGCVTSVAAAALIWWDPDTPVAVFGFVVMGASLAGVFPALIALTPGRLGEGRASNVIAWQVGAAAAGGAGVSALVGLLIGVAGAAVLGPALLVIAVVLVAAEVLLAHLSPPGP